VEEKSHIKGHLIFMAGTKGGLREHAAMIKKSFNRDIYG